MEVILDASRFGNCSMEIAVVFSSTVGKPRVGVAGYLPPVRQREMLWRKEQAGAPMSQSDLTQLTESGFLTTTNMKSYDYARTVSHYLRCAGFSFNNFKAEPLPWLAPGFIRFWCPESKRWWRGPASTNDRVHEQLACVPEMPDCYLTGPHPAILLLTADQEGCGRRCCHFFASPEVTSQGTGSLPNQSVLARHQAEYFERPLS